LPKWLKRLIVIILIIGIIGTIVFVKRSGQSVVPVQIGSVTQQDLNRTVVTSGRLKAVDEQEFFTPEDSTLMELNVKLGDRVKKGDVLGRLDTLELARLYQNAVATLASKKAELARAEAQDDGLILKNAEAAYIKPKNHLDRVNSFMRPEP
jgi:HlyD family secretion protein